MKVIKPNTINFCWRRKLCPQFVHDFTGLMTEPTKGIMKLWIWQKGGGDGEGFQDTDLGEIQQLRDTKPDDLKGDLTEMSASF